MCHGISFTVGKISDRLEQTVFTLIRLLLRSSLIKVYTVSYSICIALLYCKNNRLFLVIKRLKRLGFSPSTKAIFLLAQRPLWQFFKTALCQKQSHAPTLILTQTKCDLKVFLGDYYLLSFYGINLIIMQTELKMV